MEGLVWEGREGVKAGGGGGKGREEGGGEGGGREEGGRRGGRRGAMGCVKQCILMHSSYQILKPVIHTYTCNSVKQFVYYHISVIHSKLPVTNQASASHGL